MCANKWQPSGEGCKTENCAMQQLEHGHGNTNQGNRGGRGAEDGDRQRLPRTHANARGHTDKDTYAARSRILV